MQNRTVSAGVGLARVLAHCGGDPAAALRHLTRAIASAPSDPEPYTVLAELWRDRPTELAGLMRNDSLEAVLAQSYISFLKGDMDGAALALGSVTGARPDIAWGAAPWFSDARFLDAVSADALAEAAMRTMDYGHDLDTDSMRERFQPWFHAIDTVSTRQPLPDALAKMAILLRACGLTDASFTLCDRADTVERTMLTEVVRAGTWRKLGDPEQTAAAFERALILDPTNWSLYLDLADIRVEQGNFTAAVQLTTQGLTHEPTEPTLRAANAAYRTHLTGSPTALTELLELAPNLPNTAYRNVLLNHACAAPSLPTDLVAAARHIQNS
ncbi:tetratricopeptide repeat protein [Streptomyces sp. LBUM 1476]|nr:tetratricopeptide repeat protein [Streptomyces sp. LBUM 1476]MBZ3914607.1 tetratricopeptide repeat protein [Streptomyces acidiscabies]GAV43504.1 tetratricopeptide repeat protein [Streptomyces acidiscabies]